MTLLIYKCFVIKKNDNKNMKENINKKLTNLDWIKKTLKLRQ